MSNFLNANVRVIVINCTMARFDSRKVFSASKRWSLPEMLPCSLPTMAPHPGIDTDQIKEKARKDLLDLLEGVCEISGSFRPNRYIY